MKIYSNITPGIYFKNFLGDVIKVAFDSKHEAAYFDGMVMDLTMSSGWDENDSKYELIYPYSAYYSVLVVLEDCVKNGAELIKIN